MKWKEKSRLAHEKHKINDNITILRSCHAKSYFQVLPWIRKKITVHCVVCTVILPVGSEGRSIMSPDFNKVKK